MRCNLLTYTNCTFAACQRKIHDCEGLPPELQRISLRSKYFGSSDQTLSDHGITPGVTVSVSLALRGGHCPVPCGSFNDCKLVADVKEASATIRKAAIEVSRLSPPASPLSFNQMTRWINVKEKHADKIIALVVNYCLCQCVKPFGDNQSSFKSDNEYIAALRAHHAVIQAAMAVKQSLTEISRLDAAVDEMTKMYLPSSTAGNAHL